MVYKMSEKDEKYWYMLNKDDIKWHPKKADVLYTTQKNSVYCHKGGKKPENIHI